MSFLREESSLRRPQCIVLSSVHLHTKSSNWFERKIQNPVLISPFQPGSHIKTGNCLFSFLLPRDVTHTHIFSVLFKVSEIGPVVLAFWIYVDLFPTQSTCFSELSWSSVEIRLALLNIFVYFTLHHNRHTKFRPPICSSHQIPLQR